MRLKVNPHGLRVGVIKDWDSRWSEALHMPTDFWVVQNCSTTRVVGKVKEWNNQNDRGMKNVPRKKPHHK